jgi:uncharacterized protein (DUF1499 family)
MHLTADDGGFLEEVRRRRLQCLQTIRRIPIAVLIWGPAADNGSAVAATRVALRESLRRNGHAAHFSEELYDPNEPFSIQAQQAADVEAHDVVFSLPETPGSIAEAHDFFKLPGISRKLIVFLDRQWNDGYANKSLIELRSLATADIILYEAGDMPNCILEQAVDVVHRLQEAHYFLGRRA